MRLINHALRRMNSRAEAVGEGVLAITLQVRELAVKKGSRYLKKVDLARSRYFKVAGTKSERGDVPGWVLVVLMTTGLVTAIWTIAAPRLSAILRNSLDAMNGIR